MHYDPKIHCPHCEGVGNDSRDPEHVVGEPGPCSYCGGSGKLSDYKKREKAWAKLEAVHGR